MRILLADDEKELANALVAILSHNHYSVDVVYNGEDALDYLVHGQNYDCAVLDIMMPKMDGITVIRKAREQGVTLPVIFLSAKSELDDKVFGLDSGADDYLTKPFESVELLARIRALTRRQEVLVDTVLKYGNVSLHRNTFMLETPTQSIILANKEFQMMEMFLMNLNQTLSLEQFLDKIWGYDGEVDSSVVWVNISNLRRKLSQLQANISIKVIRNVGYTLEVNHDS